jgi:trimeric autotransporter adhesin
VNFKADVEALNAFNTPQFGQPGITLTLQPGGTLASAAFTSPTSNATTRAITSQLGFSRIIQIGGRISF